MQEVLTHPQVRPEHSPAMGAPSREGEDGLGSGSRARTLLWPMHGVHWRHTKTSILKALGSLGWLCPHPHSPPKTDFRNKMNQVLQASLFTQGYKSISGEAFKINSLLALSLPFSYLPLHTHTPLLLWVFLTLAVDRSGTICSLQSQDSDYSVLPALLCGD